MKTPFWVVILLYIGLTSEHTLTDLTQNQNKNLDILEDSELNSDKYAHNIDRKVESVNLKITTTIKPLKCTPNHTNAHVLQKDFKNVSLYENVKSKENDINERSFVIIDSKYKVPFKHQSMLRKSYMKPLSYRDFVPHGHRQPWPFPPNSIENSQRFSDDTHKEDHFKIYIDPYYNPNTAYVQPNQDHVYKLRVNNIIADELRNLEMKVKAANELMDYQYRDIKDKGNLLDKIAKDPIKLAQESRKYSDLVKVPAVRPETLKINNQYNKQMKTSDLIDNYQGYEMPRKILKLNNDYRDNVFDHTKHVSDFHESLPVSSLRNNYFANMFKAPDDNDGYMYVNSGNLNGQQDISTNRIDSTKTFVENKLPTQNTNNETMINNGISYTYKYKGKDYVENNIQENYSARNSDVNIHLVKETTPEVSDATPKYFASNLKFGTDQKYFKSNQYRPIHIFDGVKSSKSVIFEDEQVKKNFNDNSDETDELPTNSYYLNDELKSSDSNPIFTENKVKQPSFINTYDIVEPSSVKETVPEKAKNNNYLRDKYRPKSTITSTNNGKENYENKMSSPSTISHSYSASSKSNDQEDAPRIEIHHPDSNDNFLTIKFHPSDHKDNPVIKIRPNFGVDRPTNIDNHISSPFNKVYTQPNNIEVYPKLNNVYSPVKQSEPPIPKYNLNGVQSNSIQDTLERPNKSRIISKLPPPDLTEDEVTMKLDQKDNVFKELSKKINEISEADSEETRIASNNMDKSQEDCVMNTLVRRISNKSVVVTSKPLKQGCVYPECMEKAILKSDPNNPTCECEYAITQNMSKNSDYGDLEIPV